MSAPALTLPLNCLLGGLTPAERAVTLAQCEMVELVTGDILCEPDEPYTHAYFPLRGVIALVTVMGRYRPLEMGLIGNEGMLGATLALGVGTAPMRALVQGAGTAWRITRDRFQQALLTNPGLRRIIYRYLYVRLTQSAQSAACTHFHEIEARLARWLLMTQDRAHADHFHLTHEVLATLLGVRRSGISLAAGALQHRGLIRYARGDIRILDRPGLEGAACGCYAALLADYAEQFAWPTAPGVPRQDAAPAHAGSAAPAVPPHPIPPNPSYTPATTAPAASATAGPHPPPDRAGSPAPSGRCIALADSRLLSFDGKTVELAYQDYRYGGQKEVMALIGGELVWRFLLHGGPCGFLCACATVASWQTAVAPGVLGGITN